jgi:hypothetical protein
MFINIAHFVARKSMNIDWIVILLKLVRVEKSYKGVRGATSKLKYIFNFLFVMRWNN